MWPQDCKDQTRQYDRQSQNKNNKKDPQNYCTSALGRSKIFEGLNMFNGTNLTLIVIETLSESLKVKHTCP